MTSSRAVSSRAHALRLTVSGLLTLLPGMPALADRTLISAEELAAGTARAEATRVAEQSACTALTGTTRDVCHERARGKAWVAKAELQVARTGSRASQEQLAVARVDSAYALANMQCKGQASETQLVCAKQAHTDRMEALAAWKHHRRMTEARPGAHGGACAVQDGVVRDGCRAAAPAEAAMPASR
ncbi:hypothetical protein NYO99_03405 [Pelomonas sp. UHG3]|uniref:Uncharacterized protein n=1 Tax=Roseateles hydrophilus TaxID=2975054 RepID=A0ACC6C6J2_9BURK|nr:hypothetical protein [Pelomonas sp. UHG3]MCY4744012.1 hypothetical protein [Pelomonas sp. UHG3]